MAIIPLKAWYLEQYEPLGEIIKHPPDLRLNRNSLLKSGLRADFLNARGSVESAQWFSRYLEGETIDFYIEGSGTYTIANIDLISQEIYFTKQEINVLVEPSIFFSYQEEYQPAKEVIGEVLNNTIEEINKRSRLSLSIQYSKRPAENPLRLSNSQLRQIRKSLLFVADTTAIQQTDDTEKPRLLLSPITCVELGYALNYKRSGEILLIQQERFEGEMPFDLSHHQQLLFKTAKELGQLLPQMLKTLLARFSLN